MTLRFISFPPVVSLAAGIMILILPKFLRYTVGVHLIVVGLLGFLGHRPAAAGGGLN